MAKQPVLYTDAENKILEQGIDGLIASAKRQRNTDKRPAFAELAEKWERELQTLKTKIQS